MRSLALGTGCRIDQTHTAGREGLEVRVVWTRRDCVERRARSATRAQKQVEKERHGAQLHRRKSSTMTVVSSGRLEGVTVSLAWGVSSSTAISLQKRSSVSS